MYKGNSVSAVLFVYNEQKFIGAALDSILKQSVPVDQIIVIDDFSTDNTKDIVLEYAQKYPIIQYDLNDIKGKIHAYQKGLKQVATDYFFIFGGDDVLMENYVIEMYSLLEKNKVPFGYANYIMTDVNLRPIKFEAKKGHYTCAELLHHNFTSGSIFAHKSIIDKIIPLPSGLLFEDWYTSIKLSYYFKASYISERPLVYYRRHSEASTATFNTKAKYFYHLDRNIRLFTSIQQEQFIRSRKEKAIIQSKIRFFQTLRSYTFTRGLKIAVSREISLKDRFKLLFFPVYFGLKYK